MAHTLLKPIGTSLVAIAFTLAAPVTPAAAQTTNECSEYASSVCPTYWDQLGYSSVKECWLQVYADCRNGIYPDIYASYVPPAAGDPRRWRALNA